MSGFLLPVLFWKPGLATVPLLEISLVPGGAAATHASVRRPFEVLDQSIPPLGTQILPTLLPRYARLEHYACTYRLPPRDVSQYVDEFPRGLSHLLAVSLAFYALGADKTLGGRRFQEKLQGWTATGYPDKAGRIRPVDQVQEKLDALEAEGKELESLGAPVRAVLLPEGNRTAVTRTPEGLRLHFVGGFEEALRAVFGAPLLKTYARARRPTMRLLAVTVAVLLVVGGAIAALRETGTAVLAVPSRDNPRCVEIRYADGRTVLAGPYRGKVITADVARDAEENVLAVVVGLAHEGEDMGNVLWLERNWLGRWKEVWRKRPFGEEPAQDGNELRLGVSRLEAIDILPEYPGPEVIATFGGIYYPSTLCILTGEGEIARQLWHCGIIGNWIALDNPTRLVFTAANNGLDTKEQPWDDSGVAWDRVFFCIRPADIAGRGPWRGRRMQMPVGAREAPMAKFQWYRRLVPKGHHSFRFDSGGAVHDPRAEFTLRVATKWLLEIGANGGVLKTVEGDPLGDDTPEPGLVEVDLETR